MYKARLIDHEGVTVKNIEIAGKMPRILTAVSEPVEVSFDPDQSPIVQNTITYIEFEYDFTTWDGVRIYRRVTPLWRD